MSKDNYREKVRRSRLIPKEFKKKYNRDHEDLKEELEESKAELNSCIKKLSKKQIKRIKAFLLIA